MGLHVNCLFYCHIVLTSVFCRLIPQKSSNTNFHENPSSGQIKLRECLLPLGAEPFVFQFAIQKFKDQDIQNCNSVCCFVWM